MNMQVTYTGTSAGSKGKASIVDLKITGLGDKFFILISYYNYYLKLNLKESVIKSQEIISNYISQSKNIL